MRYTLTFLIFLRIFFPCSAQNAESAGGGEAPVLEQNNCLTEWQRNSIRQMLDSNLASCTTQGMLPEKFPSRESLLALDWPLRKSPNLDYNSYYLLANFVDHSNTNSVLDYHCSNRTYDGHKGIDITTWPFPWYLYENDYIEVIAAAAGIIIGKNDGNFDQNCSWNGSGNWNAVYVKHADGSIAWYGHLKSNSLTNKSVGAQVAKGEYLGLLASSGFSSSPHLHLELYDASNKLIDPYAGSCNTLNASSWWASQPPFREPTLNTLKTHNSEPIHGCPGINENPHFANAFAPGQLVYFAAYYHDQLLGDVSTWRIRRPNNTIWQTWNHTSNNTYSASWWWWSFFLPPGGPFGTWIVEIDYQGKTQQHAFQYGDVSSLPNTHLEPTRVFPNPVSQTLFVVSEPTHHMTLHDAIGNLLVAPIEENKLDCSNLPNGVYYLRIYTSTKYHTYKFVVLH